MKAFVTVGVERKPFARLLQAVDRLVAEGVLSPETLVQSGHNKIELAHCTFKKFLSFNDMVKEVREADIVIAHAGVGSVLLCRQLGKVPLVVPRSGAMGEHVDNHQLEFARIMHDQGFAVMAETPEALRGVLESTPGSRWRADAVPAGTEGLAHYLEVILKKLG